MIDCSAAAQAETEPVHTLMSKWIPQDVIGHVQTLCEEIVTCSSSGFDGPSR